MNSKLLATNRVIYARLGNFVISIAFETFNLSELIDFKIIFDQKIAKIITFLSRQDVTVKLRINLLETVLPQEKHEITFHSKLFCI